MNKEQSTHELVLLLRDWRIGDDDRLHRNYAVQQLMDEAADIIVELESFSKHWHQEIEAIGAMLDIGAPEAGEVPRAVQALIARLNPAAGG